MDKYFIIFDTTGEFFGHSWFNTCLEETEDMGRHVICVAQ